MEEEDRRKRFCVYNHKSSRKCPNKDKLVDKKF